MAGRGAGRTGGRAGKPTRAASARRGTGARTAGTQKPATQKPDAQKHGAQARPVPGRTPPRGPLRLGAIEGATPGKWVDTWRERMPKVAIDLVPLTVDDQRHALVAASVDAALVRLPIDRTGLHVIGLYDEVPVVVCAADSHLTAADELTLADLAGEVIVAPRHPPLSVDVPGGAAPRFAPPDTVADAIAIAASGVGVVIVPMSLARLHHRKDAAHRPLRDGPTSTVALAWPAGGGSETDPLVDTFIGIVRGRTANSSR